MIGDEEIRFIVEKWLQVQNQPSDPRCLDSLAALGELKIEIPGLSDFKEKALALVNMRIEMDGKVPFNGLAALYRLDRNLYEKAFNAFAAKFEANRENRELNDFVEAILHAENPDRRWGTNKEFLERNKIYTRIAERRLAASPDTELYH